MKESMAVNRRRINQLRGDQNVTWQGIAFFNGTEQSL